MSTNHMKDNLRATIGLVKVQWEAKGTEKGQPPVASRIWENSFGCDSHSCVSSRSRFKANCDEQILKQALKRIAMAGSEAGGSSTSRTRAGIPSSPTRTIVDPYGRYCIVFYCIAWYCMVFHGIDWYCILYSEFEANQLVQLPILTAGLQNIIHSIAILSRVAQFTSIYFCSQISQKDPSSIFVRKFIPKGIALPKISWISNVIFSPIPLIFFVCLRKRFDELFVIRRACR